MIKLVKALGVAAGSNVFGVLSGIIRAKILSVTVGGMGFGAFNQANTVIGLVGNSVLIGQNTALVKLLSEDLDCASKMRAIRLIRIAVAIASVGTIATVVVLGLFRETLTLLLFGSHDYGTLFFVLVVTLPLNSGSLILTAVINGFSRIRTLAYANVVTQSASLCLIAFAVWFAGDQFYNPYFAAFPVLQLAVVIFYARGVLKSLGVSLREFFTPAASEDVIYLKSLWRFGVPIFAQGLVAIGAQLYLRSTLVTLYGLEDYGYIQAYFATGYGYFTILTTALTVYALPRFSSLAANEDVTKEIEDLLSLVLYVFGPVCLVMQLFGAPIITVLYASSFTAHMDVYNVLVLSTYISLLDWSIGVLVLAKRRLFFHVSLNLIYQFLLVLVLTFGHPFLGVTAFGVAYLVAGINQLTWNFYYVRYRMGVHITSRIVSLAVLLLPVLIGGTILAEYGAYVAGASLCVFLVGWTVFGLDKERRVWLWSAIKNRRSRKIG